MTTVSLLLLITTQTLARQSYDFNLGWRFAFSKSLSPLQCNASLYTVNASGVLCLGLTGIYGPETVADCVQAACDAGAPYWQLADPRKPQTPPCRVGTPTQVPCAPLPGGWIGGGNPTANASALPFDTAPASLSFDDSAWAVVDAPHDALINQSYSQAQSNGQGNLPKQRGWYRKHFFLPLGWQHSHVSVYFEGVFSVATLFLNGKLLLTHSSGYTSFAVVLSNCSSINWGALNVLAVHVDSFVTSGWWYEGFGLFRGVKLTQTSLLRIADDGLFSRTTTDGNYAPYNSTPSSGTTVSLTTLAPFLTVEHGGAPGLPAVGITAYYSLFSHAGALLSVSALVNATVLPGTGAVTLPPPSNFTLLNLSLWSLARPYLYTLQATLLDGSSGAVADAVNVTLGVRDVAWTAATGMSLNGDLGVKLRGFCNHASFAGVGMGIPPRINLFRLQQLRALGGNALRMSHNPGCPSTLAMADALGVGVLDENRIFADDPVDISNMGDMVRRDRQHPAVLWWSFCNEASCSDGTQPNLDYKIITTALDGTRAVTANMFAVGQVESLPNATEILDVQGYSHGDQYDFAWFRKHFPGKPFAATECCSCESQRGEDGDLPKTPGAVWSSWSNQPCTRDQSQASNGPRDVAATFVWTLHDYFGEPEGWPHVSSGFGQIDLAGFLKPAASWYRAFWLSGNPPSDPARPPLFSAAANLTIALVESWAPPPPGAKPQVRTLHVYTSAPFAALLQNGTVPLAPRTPVPPFTWATFTVPWSPGSISALALAGDSAATVLGSSSPRASWGAPAALRLTLDAPTAESGTGRALYLDGIDVGLLRASIVDADGNVCEDATGNVSFYVAGGPGRIVGVGNGDPSCQSPNKAAWRQAYHGLARGLLGVTVDARGSDEERALRRSIEIEAGVGPLSSTILPPGATTPTTIIVTASVPGLPGSNALSVPTSADPSYDPLAIAAASVHAAAF